MTILHVTIFSAPKKYRGHKTDFTTKPGKNAIKKFAFK